MSEKQRRLRDLSQHTDRTPATCWGYGEFAALRPAPGTRWWVRSLAEEATERYRHAQGPWNPSEVDAFFATLDETAQDDTFVVQQYVRPVVAGVTLCFDGGLLTEGVTGPASALLREGGAGDMLASHGGSLSWQLDRRAIANAAVLRQAHDSIPPSADALWEWIVDDQGQVFHVDRKNLPVPLIGSVPVSGPPSVWTLGCPQAGPLIELPDTSIRGLAALSQCNSVLIRRGSPLAHFCYEAVTRGHYVTLEIPDVL